jgi:serine/threonine protein kinase
MEYINGGGLSNCLKKYMDRHKKAFPEEIVQHLMRQIIEGLYYLHSKKIIHRDLKLDNIMINFDSEADKENLNMMKARVKIIDFGFAIQLTSEKKDLTYSAVGSPINMDPIILNKFSKRKDPNLGYDEKADIWSIGTVCYELLIGKAVFNATTMNDLVDKVENGTYTVPKSLSREVISFLNEMLRYESKYRLSAGELLKHPFLTKNPADFKRMDMVPAQKKPNSDFKKNKSIWAIYKDEEKFVNMGGGKNMPDAPLPEDNYTKNDHDKYNTTDNIEKKSSNKLNNDEIRGKHKHLSHKELDYLNNNMNNNLMNYNNNPNYNKSNNYKGATSFYGQNMFPQGNGMPQMNPPMMNMQQQLMLQYPSFGVPMPYNYSGGIYQLNQPPNDRRLSTKNQTNKMFKDMYKNSKYEDDCSIQ